jgi:hypothetical protein
MIEFAQGLNKLNEKWNLESATCIEKFDLNKCGIAHNKCVDDDLVIKIFFQDKELMKFLGVEFIEPTLFDSSEIVEKKTKR